MSSLVLKHVDLYFNPSLEFALMLCFVYLPYALAEGIHLSGTMKYFKKTFSISFVHLGIDEVYDLGCGLDEVVYLQLKFSSFAKTCIMYMKFRKDVNILKHPLWYFRW